MVKNPPVEAGDRRDGDWIPGLGGFPGGGHGNPLQCGFLLGESHGQRNLWTTVHRVSESDMTEVT